MTERKEPVNIFGFFKHLKENVFRRLKMMGTKTMYNRMFLKIPLIKRLMINVRKLLQMNITMSD